MKKTITTSCYLEDFRQLQFLQFWHHFKEHQSDPSMLNYYLQDLTEENTFSQDWVRSSSSSNVDRRPKSCCTNLVVTLD